MGSLFSIPVLTIEYTRTYTGTYASAPADLVSFTSTMESNAMVMCIRRNKQYNKLQNVHYTVDKSNICAAYVDTSTLHVYIKTDENFSSASIFISDGYVPFQYIYNTALSSIYHITFGLNNSTVDNGVAGPGVIGKLYNTSAECLDALDGASPGIKPWKIAYEGINCSLNGPEEADNLEQISVDISLNAGMSLSEPSKGKSISVYYDGGYIDFGYTENQITFTVPSNE